MCVAIVMEPGTELSLDEITKMGKANGDGVGFAWADGDSVQWFKTVVYNPEKIAYHINARKDYFRLVHFRLSTAGGVRNELCHPFEVGPLASSESAGTGSMVLIHNGHWHRWSDVFDILKNEQILPDGGPWSDTRLMALLASYDPEWLDTVGGRVATMDSEGNIKMWGDWSDLRTGIKVSNKIWENHNYSFKRSGKDRHWQGWGWSEDNWKDYDRAKEDAKKAREEAEALKEKKEQKENEQKSGSGQGQAGEQEEKAGTICVAGGSGDGKVLSLSAQKEGEDGGYCSEGNGERVNVPMGKVQRQTDAGGTSRIIYDHTPWQNPSTKRWYWLDPKDLGKPGKPKISELTESRAREVMGKAAPASTKDGNVKASK
jgi:hypothetical protein